MAARLRRPRPVLQVPVMPIGITGPGGKRQGAGRYVIVSRAVSYAAIRGITDGSQPGKAT